MTSLKEIIHAINHSREKRGYFSNLILGNPELLPELMDICAEVDTEISCKASWGLEFLCKTNLEKILPHLDQFFAILPQVYRHSAVRPMSKICECLILGYYKEKLLHVRSFLNREYRQKIIESCFDWLITDQKVAPQAYAMTSLYLLGTEFEWVHPELKTILENNYHSGSAAYKARARLVLKKIQ